MDQQHYVGLDVSLETISICVVDQTGAIIWRGKCSTAPDSISQVVRAHAPAAVRVGLETGVSGGVNPRITAKADRRPSALSVAAVGGG